ncbi:hypothetical protein L9F63_003629 [Diploptera punctata]|uniref:Uncharacterized protein n=1 Tax=Diploptera punctata TaxID=6984 RepID=A0AAD7ZKK0_DIPPU|nr:hypothetical protein L9F63_003629 [Diploptera punctata]
MEDQVENLEEARKIIKNLRERYRSQSHQLLAWRRRVKAQEELITKTESRASRATEDAVSTTNPLRVSFVQEAERH